MTEVESEYDAVERDGWLALRELDDATCPRCGQLRSMCSDPNTAFYPQLDVCWGEAATAVANRKWHKLHEKTPPDRAGYLPTDGGMVWAALEDLSPDDMFLGRVDGLS